MQPIIRKNKNNYNQLTPNNSKENYPKEQIINAIQN